MNGTLVVIIVVGFVFAAVVLLDYFLFDYDKPDLPKATRPTDKNIGRVLTAAERRKQEMFARQFHDRTQEVTWATAAAHRLADLWAINLHDAIKMILAEMEVAGIKYPDPDYDWSKEAAREFAEEYAQNYGEEHGSNT